MRQTNSNFMPSKANELNYNNKNEKSRNQKQKICFEPKVTRIFIVFLSMKLDIINYGLKHGARKRMCAVSRANVNSHTKRAAFWACHKYETHYPTKDKNGCDSIYCDCCLFALKCCERFFFIQSKIENRKQEKWSRKKRSYEIKTITLFKRNCQPFSAHRSESASQQICACSLLATKFIWHISDFRHI